MFLNSLLFFEFSKSNQAVKTTKNRLSTPSETLVNIEKMKIVENLFVLYKIIVLSLATLRNKNINTLYK